MSTVIKVENLSKQYRLGQVGTGSLSHDVNRWWHRMRGKEDPYLKIGEENDRTAKGSSDYVWALKDINFDVQQGEVLGIIGRNGAGKSTLLKILSRTTAPTTGSIKIKGRIASLLEVGTGFHPELSGRDNIFLNGAILGMTKQEIKNKFDEIVDFAGVERYIDTPVKRYSSGMYVRLAFGVAAHLEPEILIVDEVLAVGDAEFQKKALGKMKDVSGKDGRTVLFVSHNMAAIDSLCDRVIIMNKGSIEHIGETKNTVAIYNSNVDFIFEIDSNRFLNKANSKLIVTGVKVEAGESAGTFAFRIAIESINYFPGVGIAIIISDSKGVLLSTLYTKHTRNLYPIAKGSNEVKCTVVDLPFNFGEYHIGVWLSEDNATTSDYIENAIKFNIPQRDLYGTGYLPNPNIHGPVAVRSYWEVEN